MLSEQNSGPLQLAAIGMGANLGHKKTTLLAAWRDLSQQAGIQALQLSSPYLSAPFEMDSTNGFVNAVGLIKTALPAVALLHILQELEARYGRSRDPGASGYQDRSLDLDLLFWNDLCLATDELTLPHPRLHERLFVLAPLAELLPRWQHPVSGCQAAALLSHLQAQQKQFVQRSFWSHDPELHQH